MIKETPSYYAVIIATVRYDNRLSDSEKLLYGEITALSQVNGTCWASNDYFARLYDVSVSTISRRISNLKKYGYIGVDMIYKENSKEIDKRIIKIDNTYTQNCIGGIRKSDNTPIRKFDKDSITSKSNNTSINTNVQNEYFEEFWKSYPRKINKKKCKTLYKEITKEEHFKIIEDINNRLKTKQWKLDKENVKYIPHPTTYLNAERWNDEVETYDNQRTIPVL